MDKLTIKLEKRSLTLDPSLTYTVYGEELTAEQAAKTDFSHLDFWLDQKMVLQDLKLHQEASFLYHPVLVADINKHKEASVYWGKNHHQALAIFKRQNVGKSEERTVEERVLAKPLPNANNISSRKSQTVKIVDEMGYGRSAARELVNAYLDEHGMKYINLSPKQLALKVDESARLPV